MSRPFPLAIRRAVPFLPIPIFNFQSWIGSLLFALAVWLALTPWAFRGLKWTRRLAIPVALLAGIGNGLAHIVSSIYYGRFMPGVYSAPLILLSAVLLRGALRKEK